MSENNDHPIERIVPSEGPRPSSSAVTLFTIMLMLLIFLIAVIGIVTHWSAVVASSSLVMLALIGATVLCIPLGIAGAAYHQFRKSHLHLEHTRVDLEMKQEQLAAVQDERIRTNERHAVELLLMQTRLAADPNGNRPFLVNPYTHQVTEVASGNYMQPVPTHYHIEEDNSESSGADAAQLASRILTEARNLIGGKYDQKQLPGAGPTIARPSQEAILDQLPYNSFVVSPGVNADTGEIVLVNLLEVPHVKFIGAPGFGKSCLAASILDQVSQTNDRQHLQLALLDCEHKTSRLFEQNENIARVRVGGRIVDLVATHADMVAVQLGFLKREMMRRAELSESELDRTPVIIMYVEEMLSLQYEVDPKLLQQMVDDILILAVRARKYRMFLLSCMQTDYSTTEMKVSQKMYRFRGAAAIDPTAARAAGFQNTDLVKVNFASGQKGQFVIEYPGFSNIVLVASYDVKRKLQQLEAVGSRSAVHAPVEHNKGNFQTEPDRVIVDADSPETSDLQPRPSVPFRQETGVNAPVEPTYRGTEPKRYLLNQDEIGQFAAAYKACGSIEKALDAIGKSGRYKAHGSEIVRVFNLRKDA